MAFKNEYVPPLEQETSEFLKKAREILHTGYSKYDAWTVDRERDMVLFHQGSGRELESANEDFWLFIDHQGVCEFDTKRLLKNEISPEEIATTYELKRYWGGEGRLIPDAATLANIKEALREHGKWHLFNPEAYMHYQLTLTDATTGKEI